MRWRHSGLPYATGVFGKSSQTFLNHGVTGRVLPYETGMLERIARPFKRGVSGRGRSLGYPGTQAFWKGYPVLLNVGSQGDGGAVCYLMI